MYVVRPGGWLSSPERVYVEGPRKGQTEKITNADVEQHRRQAEAKFGRYIPGSLLSDPRFIPGRQRKTLPLYQTDPWGNRYKAGWIDAEGVHLAPERPMA